MGRTRKNRGCTGDTHGQARPCVAGRMVLFVRFEKVKELLLVISALVFSCVLRVSACSHVIKALFSAYLCILHYKGLYPMFKGHLS